MNDKLTQAALRLEGQPMFRLLETVKKLEAEGKSIVHFEIGDPDFETAQVVVDACVRSLRSGHTHYSSSYGLRELRQAIVDHTPDELGFKPSLGQVIVTPGVNPLIYFVMQCLVNPDEEVIIADPAFSTYYSVLSFLNIKAVRVPLKESNAFRMDPADIRARVTPKTKLIILNSPHNPTGAVMTSREMEAVYRIAEEHDLFILSDEIYRSMSYAGHVASPSAYDHCHERVIVINGFSKGYAMTGWRLGYAIAPEFLVEKLFLMVQTTVSCVPTFIQEAGIAVYDIPREDVQAMNDELKARRDLLVNGLNQLPGVRCLRPEGAFYVFANVRDTGMTSEQFADLMLHEAGVALLAGPNFGHYAQGYVRLCYAVSRAQIQEGLSRIKAALAKHASTAALAQERYNEIIRLRR